MTATTRERLTMSDDGCPHEPAEYTPGAVRFAEFPHADRMRYRAAVEAAGGEVEGYNGPALTVAVPRNVTRFYTAMAAAGLADLGRPWFFPLGTDSPPAELRHDGRYPGSAGFWLFLNLAPTDPPSGPEDY